MAPQSLGKLWDQVRVGEIETLTLQAGRTLTPKEQYLIETAWKHGHIEGKKLALRGLQQSLSHAVSPANQNAEEASKTTEAGKSRISTFLSVENLTPGEQQVLEAAWNRGHGEGKNIARREFGMLFSNVTSTFIGTKPPMPDSAA